MVFVFFVAVGVYAEEKNESDHWIKIQKEMKIERVRNILVEYRLFVILHSRVTNHKKFLEGLSAEYLGRIKVFRKDKEVYQEANSLVGKKIKKLQSRKFANQFELELFLLLRNIQYNRRWIVRLKKVTFTKKSLKQSKKVFVERLEKELKDFNKQKKDLKKKFIKSLKKK